jgi:hypothetical protein
MKVIKCETETVIKNKHTGKIYKTEKEAKAELSEEDIQRDVVIKVPSLDLFGGTGES